MICNLPGSNLNNSPKIFLPSFLFPYHRDASVLHVKSLQPLQKKQIDGPGNRYNMKGKMLIIKIG